MKLINTYMTYINNQRQIAGRMGGVQTCLRYGKEHMKEIGRLGGRPKVMTKSLSALEIEGLISGNGGLPNSLAELRRLIKRSKQRGVAGQ
jgi:general stress protein YciG